MDEIDRNLNIIALELARRRSAQNASETMHTTPPETAPNSIQLEIPVTASPTNLVHYPDKIVSADRPQLSETTLPWNQVEPSENVVQLNQSNAIVRCTETKDKHPDHPQIQTGVSVNSQKTLEVNRMNLLESIDIDAFNPTPTDDPAPVSSSLWSRLRHAIRVRR